MRQDISKEIDQSNNVTSRDCGCWFSDIQGVLRKTRKRWECLSHKGNLPQGSTFLLICADMNISSSSNSNVNPDPLSSLLPFAASLKGLQYRYALGGYSKFASGHSGVIVFRIYQSHKECRKYSYQISLIIDQ